MRESRECGRLIKQRMEWRSRQADGILRNDEWQRSLEDWSEPIDKMWSRTEEAKSQHKERLEQKT